MTIVEQYDRLAESCIEQAFAYLAQILAEAALPDATAQRRGTAQAALAIFKLGFTEASGVPADGEAHRLVVAAPDAESPEGRRLAVLLAQRWFEVWQATMTNLQLINVPIHREASDLSDAIH